MEVQGSRGEQGQSLIGVVDFNAKPIDLAKLLKDWNLLSCSSQNQYDERNQLKLVPYLNRYLQGIHAQTAVIEREYVDSDYLDDYARYYARSFNGYERKCHRIHFFSKPYSEDKIKKFICGTLPEADDKEFQETFLGFVVIRPLPLSIIGRTCLAFYEESLENDDGRRCYKAWSTVRVSFFGRELHVKCMPFLQQDSASAACATCAIWSSFSVTSDIFGDRHYCPGCITAMAMDHGLSASRCFPNSGLSVPDMTHAIRRIGLDAISRDLKISKPSNTSQTDFKDEPDRFADMLLLLGNIYAYIEARVPIILSGELRDENGKSIGHHAVAVNGYHLGENYPLDDCEMRNCHTCEHSRTCRFKMKFSSCAIDKLYVHDDQVGPSAKMELDKFGLFWRTQWDNRQSPQSQWTFHVLNFLIPIYPKMRVSYADVYGYVEDVNLILRCSRRMGPCPKREKMRDFPLKSPKAISDCTEKLLRDMRDVHCNQLMCSHADYRWDIRLQKSAAFKTEVRGDSGIQDKLRYLENSYSKFVWNVCLTIAGQPYIRFVVDATDYGPSLLVKDVILYDRSEERPTTDNFIVAFLHGAEFMRRAVEEVDSASVSEFAFGEKTVHKTILERTTRNPLILALERKVSVPH